MSFWADLEEMQKEIENLDSGTHHRHTNNRSGVSSTSTERINDLEQRAKDISTMIDNNKNALHSPRNREIQHEVDVCVKDATKSHDANVHLMNHLSALEGEISKLTQKEDMWHGTAKMIQNEVETLRTQIHGLRSSKSHRGHSHHSHQTSHSINQQRRSTNHNQSRNSKRYPSVHIDRHTHVHHPPPINTNNINTSISGHHAPTDVIMTKDPAFTDQSIHVEAIQANSVNIYQFERLQTENSRLSKELQNTQRKFTKIHQQNAQEKHALQSKINQMEQNMQNQRMQMSNKDTQIADMQSRVNGLESNTSVLKREVSDYDKLKDNNRKLQLDYQRSLQDTLSVRKDKAMCDQKLANLQNHIQELEIKCRQISNEKAQSAAEVNAQKHAYAQERKNMQERYDRRIAKLEAELNYVKKMYDEIKKKYRELQNKFEIEQPQYEALKEQLEQARDRFTEQLNNVMVHHVSNLDLISKQSEQAADFPKYVERIDDKIINNGPLVHKHQSNNGNVRPTSVRSKGHSAPQRQGIWEPM